MVSEPNQGSSEHRGLCTLAWVASSQVGAGSGPLLGTLVTITNFPFVLSRMLVSWNGKHIYRETCVKGNGSRRTTTSHYPAEMRAVAKAFLGFSLPPGSTVLVSTDNSTVFSSIIRGVGDTLNVPQKGDRTPFPAGLQSVVLPVGGLHSGENVIANLPSCQDHSLLPEWLLNQEVTRLLFRL